MRSAAPWIDAACSPCSRTVGTALSTRPRSTKAFSASLTAATLEVGTATLPATTTPSLPMVTGTPASCAPVARTDSVATAPAPSGVPRPSDVGSDEEFLLGSVSASVTARPRTALNLAPELPPLLPASAADVPAPAPAPAPVEATAPVGFSLPTRASTAAVDALLASYRMFLLAAALGVGALLLARRSPTT